MGESDGVPLVVGDIVPETELLGDAPVDSVAVIDGVADGEMDAVSEFVLVTVDEGESEVVSDAVIVTLGDVDGVSVSEAVAEDDCVEETVGVTLVVGDKVPERELLGDAPRDSVAVIDGVADGDTLSELELVTVVDGTMDGDTVSELELELTTVDGSEIELVSVALAVGDGDAELVNVAEDD